MIALALLLATQQPDLSRAESLLAAGKAFDAAQVAARVVARRPHDAAARLLLGRAHLARPVVGRYAALAAFRAAARLAPEDPAPLYWQSEVGLLLGSDEGEGIAREALIRLFALAPDYRDSWSRFSRLFGNAAVWRRADGAFARHPDDPLALTRRGHLAILLEDPARAEAVLARARARGADGVETALLRAEAAYLGGDPPTGDAWIDTAVAHAAEDSAGALWTRFWPIASPAERAAFGATPPAERSGFFRRFLGRRDPNLLTPENERLREHFARVAHARRHFRLLHPLNQYHRSALVRGIAAGNSRVLLQDLTVAAPALFVAAPTARARAAAGLGGDGADLAPTDSNAITAFFLAGLDARGLLWLRHGRPAQRIMGAFDALRPAVDGDQALDVESWVYPSPDGPISVGFRRGTGGVFGFGAPAGDFVFEPVSDRQVRATRALLRSDATAFPAPLAAPAWVAFFPDSGGDRTAVYVRTRAGRAAAALWGPSGQVAGAAGDGVLRLSVVPGAYDIGVDVDSAGRLGRVRGAVDVPGSARAGLGLSSLVLGAGDSADAREAILARMPPDLAVPAGAPLTTYAEIHGLHVDSLGLVRYRVRYSFTPRRGALARLFTGGAPVVLEFEREARGTAIVAERIVIGPSRLARGRYRVTLAVTDLAADVKTESAAIDIIVR